MTNSVLLDANILMELFFRRPRAQATEAAIAAVLDDSLLTTSVLALTILFYYVEKDGFDKTRAHSFVASYKVLDMGEVDYAWARQNDLGDFEDALQTACALRHGCRKIITLDQAFAKRHRPHIAFTLVR